MAGSTLVTGEVVQATVWCDDTEQASMNVLHFLVGTPVGLPVTDADFAFYLMSFLLTYYPPLLYTASAIKGVGVQRIQASPMPVTAYSTQAAVSGAAGSTGMARQTCGLISWYTALAKRANRGRTYIPFPATVHDVGLGIPNGGYVALLTAIKTFLIGPMTVNNIAATGTVVCSLVIYHKKATVALSSYTPVVYGYPRAVWATQRRRGSYGRANTSPI